MNRPWMPLYVGQYLKKTQHLRALESGAYLHLIMAYWANGGLPNDDKKLAAIAKLTDREWAKSKTTLAEFFGPEWKSHHKIDEELEKATDISTKRRAAVEQREIKRRSSDRSNDDHMQTQPQPHQQREDKNLPSEGRESGYSAPKHGQFMKRKSLVYFHKGTPEWDAHAADYATFHGLPPEPDRGGGYWFKMAGEAELPTRKIA